MATGSYLTPNYSRSQRAVGSLVVRASDSRPEGLGSMPDATKHPPSTHGFTCRNCGGGDRGRVAIYRPFGELRRAKIVLSPVWCSRPTTGVPLAHATMNFVGLDLTTSDRWHQKTTKLLRHGGTPNSCRATSPLVKFVDGVESSVGFLMTIAVGVMLDERTPQYFSFALVDVSGLILTT
ncbi:hypothetical protein TNCV_2629171 [Trichonephila clavipes]|uniref:Uncharacterized protein n=1 Tax=Trichonephila clavipes TaxID=2585209 RepID=A0A8X6VJR3_TRICX|nr:hypothetical protein TNCV_2629171 [Trichonephila clavipes]